MKDSIADLLFILVLAILTLLIGYNIRLIEERNRDITFIEVTGTQAIVNYDGFYPDNRVYHYRTTINADGKLTIYLTK